MRMVYTSLLCVALTSLSTLAQLQPPDTLWTKGIGGLSDEYGYSAKQTADGGFIAVGQTRADVNDDWDLYLVRTNAFGDTLWTKTFGDTGGDCGYSVQQTLDGGFIIAGGANEDTWQYHGALLVMKTDRRGNILWTRLFSDYDRNCAFDIQQTDDGGYIVCGVRNSQCVLPYGDMYLIKLDSGGNTTWTRTYQGHPRFCAYSVRQIADLGYIVAGALDEDPYAPMGTPFLMKTDAQGDSLWMRILPGDVLNTVRQTLDGGYIVGGWSDRPNLSGFFMTKTDSQGNICWSRIRSYGYVEFGGYALQIPDGGFLVAGMTFLTEPQPRYVICLEKTDAAGDTLWSTFVTRTTSYSEGVYSIDLTDDGGLIITGLTAGVSSVDLLLARMESVGPPGVVISLLPVNPPIVVPAGGGIFRFNAALENYAQNPITCDVWTEVILPGGGIHSPLLLRNSITFSPGAVIQRELTQIVPGYAPLGEYTYFAKVGIYPDSVSDWDCFPFVKMAGEIPPVHNQGWACYGWDEDKEGFRIQDSGFRLLSINPNPFNASTVARFELRDASQVKLAVYDIMGQEVAVLAEGYYPAGTHQMVWDAVEMASGVYFARLEAGRTINTQKLLLLK